MRVAGWDVVRTPLRRSIVVAVVLALCAVGFGGYRWWNTDDRRAERSLSKVQDLPGVTSTSYDEHSHERRVTMSGSASVKQIGAAIAGLRAIATDHGHAGVVTVGHATGDLPGTGSYDEQLGQLLAALADVSVGGGSISVDAIGDPTVRVHLKDAKAIAAARLVATALGESPATSTKFTTVKVWRPRLGYPAVMVRSSGLGKSAALLKRLEPLAAWRPVLTLAPDNRKLRLNVSTTQDVIKAQRQAVGLTDRNTGLSVVVGQGTEKEQAFSGRADAARALSLTSALGTKARVRSIQTDLSAGEIDTSFAHLRWAGTILQQRQVKQATVHVAATDGVGGSEVTDDPATIGRVASGIGKLQTAGYDVTWDATDHARGNSGPAVHVRPSGGIGSLLDEQDHGVAVMRLLRRLEWRGPAAICFPTTHAGRTAEVCLISTSSGPYSGLSASTDEAVRLAGSWNATVPAAR